MALVNPTPIFSMGLPTPQPIVMRPLQGLDYLSSELNAPAGSLLDNDGLVVRPKGLYRTPGYESFLDGAVWSPSDTPSMIVSGWGTNGVQYPFLITQNRVFLCSWSSGYVEVPWEYSKGTVAVSGTAVTGSGTLWLTLGINAGDTFTVSGSDYVIQSVNSDTGITLRTSAGSISSGTSYVITRYLNGGNQYYADACMGTDLKLGQFLVIATPSCQIIKLYPQTQVMSNLTETAAKQPSTGGITAKAVCFTSGRIFAGNLDDGSNKNQRYMIRWSKGTDITDFSDATAYLYLTSQASAFSGEIQRMITMGTLMVCYLDDAIFVGTPSNVTNLPLSFQQLSTGGVGLVGQRAIASTVLPREGNILESALTGHFFVGDDNIYFLSASNLSISPIGNRVVRESIAKCNYRSRVQAAIDWRRRRVRFGFPRETAEIENIFDFNWETKEWSREGRKTWVLGDLMLSTGWNPVEMWDVLGDPMVTYTGDNMCVSWASSTGMEHAHVVEKDGALWEMASAENATDPDGEPVPVTIETMDYDEGAPGLVKFWRMLRLKLSWDPDLAPTVDIVFTIEISMDRGRTYRNIGDMTVGVGNDEGYINFRATGPHIRFRITSQSSVTPYYITEMTRTASIRGIQQSRRQQSEVH